MKVAYTPNEHDEYALAFSTQKVPKNRRSILVLIALNATGAGRYGIKTVSISFPILEFSAHNLTLNTKAFYDTLKMTYVLLMTQHLVLKRKKSSFNSYYRDYSYGVGFDLGGDFNRQRLLKILYPH